MYVSLMRKSNYFWLILFCIGFCLVFSISKNYFIHENQPQIENKSLNTTSYYNLTGTYMESSIYDNGADLYGETNKIIAAILVDDTLNNYKWEDIKASYPWCTGQGSLEDPYIIEKVYVDGLYKGNTYINYANIYIRHSSAHFIIKNCSLHRCGSNERGSIFLYNV